MYMCTVDVPFPLVFHSGKRERNLCLAGYIIIHILDVLVCRMPVGQVKIQTKSKSILHQKI